MRSILLALTAVCLSSCAHHAPHDAHVVPHGDLKSFELKGNTLVGIATKSQGAVDYEVWRTQVAVGSRTPLHTHDSEEIFVILQGKGKAIIGDRTVEFEAPCTLIAPAGVQHQFINTGKIPTDSIVIVGIGSKIYDDKDKLMLLPWRK